MQGSNQGGALGTEVDVNLLEGASSENMIQVGPAPAKKRQLQVILLIFPVGGDKGWSGSSGEGGGCFDCLPTVPYM